MFSVSKELKYDKPGKLERERERDGEGGRVNIYFLKNIYNTVYLTTF